MSDAAQPIAPPERSVWSGDVVAFSPGTWRAGRPQWWVMVLVGLAPVSLWVVHTRVPSDAVTLYFYGALIGAVLLGCLWTWNVFRSRGIRRRLEEIERVPAETYGQLAWRLWRRALADRRGRVEFDARTWVRRVGPDGPRTLLLDVPLPPIGVSSDVSEEVPIGLDGPIGRPERRQRLVQVALFGFNLALMIGTLRFARMDPVRVVMVAVWGTLALIALYRLGVRPIALGASSAAPGLIRVTRGGTSTEFHRRDSVLILHIAGSRIRATVTRVDGAQASFAFFSGGTDDPGLHQIIQRWCCPAARAPCSLLPSEGSGPPHVPRPV